VAEGGYVSRRLLQLVMPVFPDRRMFRIHDPEVHPDAPGGPLPPIGVLVSATREQLWIGSLQQDIDVRLVLEEWDGQPLLPDAWDEEAKARLYLRGALSIDMGTVGTAVSGLRLSGGVGNYEVRVYARYREAVVQMYTDLFNQHKDPLSDDFQREKRKLEGVERYLVQLWRDSLSPGSDRGRGRAWCDETRRYGVTTDVKGPLLLRVLLVFLTAVLPAALVLAALLLAVVLFVTGALLLTGALLAVGCFVSFWPFARKGIVA
jgi:hypothetical protein